MIKQLNNKINRILKDLNANPLAQYCKTAEFAFEALALAKVMEEYVRVYGNPINIAPPATRHFLNRKPGRFKVERSFKIEFRTNVFYFTTDVEIHGISAMHGFTHGLDLFEADVVVVKEEFAHEIEHDFNGYPAPQHIHFLGECKYGKYIKSQLREVVGLRRHSGFINRGVSRTRRSKVFQLDPSNMSPPIPIVLFRPNNHPFLEDSYAKLLCIKQEVI